MSQKSNVFRLDEVLTNEVEIDSATRNVARNPFWPAIALDDVTRGCAQQKAGKPQTDLMTDEARLLDSPGRSRERCCVQRSIQPGRASARLQLEPALTATMFVTHGGTVV